LRSFLAESESLIRDRNKRQFPMGTLPDSSDQKTLERAFGRRFGRVLWVAFVIVALVGSAKAIFPTSAQTTAPGLGDAGITLAPGSRDTPVRCNLVIGYSNGVVNGGTGNTIEGNAAINSLPPDQILKMMEIQHKDCPKK